MKLSHKKPKIYDRCKEVFGASWDKGVIITYKEVVHCKFDIPDHLEVHEQTHIKQQEKHGVGKWWDKYFVDKDFRLSQEVEAYKNQVIFLNKNYPRQQRRAILRKVYKDMTTLYGNMCTKEEAKKLLKV